MKSIKQAREALEKRLEHMINVGERLQLAQPQVDDFDAWVEATHGITAEEAHGLIRIAIHKEKARYIIREHGADMFLAGICDGLDKAGAA